MGQEDLTPPPEEESSVDQEPAESSQADGGTEPVQEQPSADGSEATPIPVETAEQSTPSTDEVEPSQPLSDKRFVTDGENSSIEDDKEHRDRLTRKAAVDTLRGKSLRDIYEIYPDLHSAAMPIQDISDLLRRIKLELGSVAEGIKEGTQKDSDYYGSPESTARELEHAYRALGGQDRLFDSTFEDIISPLRYGEKAEQEAAFTKLEDASKAISAELEGKKRTEMRKFTRLARESALERYQRDPERYAQMSVRDFVESMPDYFIDESRLVRAEQAEQMITAVFTKLQEMVESVQNPQLGSSSLRNNDIVRYSNNALRRVLLEVAIASQDSNTKELWEDIARTLFYEVAGFNEKDVPIEDIRRRVNRFAIEKGDQISPILLSDPTRPVLDQFIILISSMQKISQKYFDPYIEKLRADMNEKWGEAPHPDEPTEEAA